MMHDSDYMILKNNEQHATDLRTECTRHRLASEVQENSEPRWNPGNMMRFPALILQNLSDLIHFIVEILTPGHDDSEEKKQEKSPA